jgi:DMSO/TMAO reductase YedYZ molybdopterin-dependent catalytic subunit
VSAPHALPPGQRARDDFPRFGMTAFASRGPFEGEPIAVACRGAMASPLLLDAALLAGVPRVEQCSDFHCVTTWSRRHLRWSGWRFADVWRVLLQGQGGASDEVRWLVFRSLDGYRAEMLLEDLMHDDVLLADRLDGQPLGLEHGAPLRLVAPGHYGYKNVKHLKAIELLRSHGEVTRLGPAFMSHDRARVALEERSRVLPAWLARWLFRPVIGLTVARFERATRGIRARSNPEAHRIGKH